MSKYFILFFMFQTGFGMLAAQSNIEEAKLERLKSNWLRSPEFNYRYFEPDENEHLYAKRKRSLSSTNWEMIYDQEDYDKLVSQLTESLSFSIVQKNDSIFQLEIIAQIDSYFEIPFLNLNFEPQKLTTSTEVIPLKLEVISYTGISSTGSENKFKQIIPIKLKQEIDISNEISISGKFTIELAEKLGQKIVDKAVEINNGKMELLKIDGSRAFILESDIQKRDQIKLMCLDDEGIKTCGMSFTMPEKLYSYYSKGRSNYNEDEFRKLVKSLTVEEVFPNRIRIYDTNLILEGLLYFSPTGKSFNSEEVVVKSVKMK